VHDELQQAQHKSKCKASETDQDVTVSFDQSHVQVASHFGNSHIWTGLDQHSSSQLYVAEPVSVFLAGAGFIWPIRMCMG